MEKLLSLSQIARALSVSKNTLNAWIKVGKGPQGGVRTPTGSWRFKVTDVEEWVSSWR